MTEPPPDPANPLVALLERCVVSIADGDGTFRGSGFFVAPGEVLTCAHVVHGLGEIRVAWDTGSSAATIDQALPELDSGDPAARFHPLPDIALLRVSEPPQGHPCVRLELAEPVAGPPADMLRLGAFSVGEHGRGLLARSSATTAYEGPFDEQGHRLLKLAAGRIISGFSGAPLLNMRSGGVCGVIESSRGEQAAHGGFGVPLRSFIGALPGLMERNAAHHRDDAEWADAHRDELLGAALRAGDDDRIPIREPMIELEAGAEVAASELLRPRRAVVPLVGREQLLDELMLWRESGHPLRVAILTGAGGFGKTRLAAEVCAAAQVAGWSAGLLVPHPPRRRSSQRSRTGRGGC